MKIFYRFIAMFSVLFLLAACNNINYEDIKYQHPKKLLGIKKADDIVRESHPFSKQDENLPH